MIPLAETATRKHRSIISSSGTSAVDKSHVELAVAAGSSAACFAASRSIASVSPFNHPSQSFSPAVCRVFPSQTSAVSSNEGASDDSHLETRNRYKRSLVAFLTPPSIRSTVQFILLSTLMVGALFVAQSMYIIFHHRTFFGENTPLPISPISGVVVAVDPTQFAAHHNSRNHSTPSSSLECTTTNAQSECQQYNHSSYTWKRFSSQPDMIAARSRALDLQPLHILVIGDSMARGVGVGKSCAPVIPEKLALYLSKALGGRPVYWTVRGEPGANAGRIVRELQLQETTAETRAVTEPISSTILPKPPNTSVWDETVEKDLWIQRLQNYKEVHQGYDVAVVFTGMNDLKGIIFPFVLQGQDVDDHLEAKKRGEGYLGELQRLLHVLGFKMKRGLLEYLQRVKSKVDARRGEDDETMWSSKVRNKISESIDDLSARIDHMSVNKDPHSPTNIHTDESLVSSHQESMSEDNTTASQPYRPPLVIFPMVPIQMCPGLRYGPCRYIGLGLQRIFEGVKRKLTRMYPEFTLHLDGLQMVNFSRRFLKGNRLIQDSDIALSLFDVEEGRCRKVEETMRKFYSPYWNRMRFSPEIGDDASKWNVWSPDTIHPNDNGYDMIGEFIGEETLKKWYPTNP